MTEKRIQFNNVIQNQLPQYVREEFPLVSEFLKQYYISQEFQSASTDILQNIDQYLKLDSIKDNAESTVLTSDIGFLDDVIPASNTIGFPDSYGLLQIDDEIITYTDKTSNSFLGCVRGFSAVSSYNNSNNPDTLVFSETESSDHSALNSDGTPKVIVNLSSLFLQEFFKKIKYQITPGFENREFYSSLDKYLFLKQSKDFYSTRGTDLSFKILFNVLYGEDVKIIKPQNYLIKPSEAYYEITNDLVVESISGDPFELERSTLNQDPYDNTDITKGYASISKVERIFEESGKIYYKLSFDAGYNRDIIVDGSLYGNFSVHPKTKLIGTVLSGANTLDVDSTVGFPSSGDLSVIYEDGTEGIITYTSKNLNQFFGCQNISQTINDKTDVCLNVYAYGSSNTNSGESIKVRITSVLKNVDIVDDTYYCESGDNAIIKTLGVNPTDSLSNDWSFNISNSIDISEVSTVIANQTYRLSTKVPHNLRIGDIIDILSNDGVKTSSKVINVISSNIIVVSEQGSLDLSKTYSIQRVLSKVNSQTYSYLSNEITDVQNIYKSKDKTLVSAPSLPYYNNQPLNTFGRSVVFGGTFVGDTFNISNHGFYTGDSVYYTPGTPKLFDEGVYFVKSVDENNLKLSKSRENIYKSSVDENFNGFITLETAVENSNANKLEHYDFYSRNLSSQKLLKEIAPPIQDGKIYDTVPGTTGILVNGVEILNYKSKDKIYYGSIEKIDITNPGSGYDVINPPSLVVTDSVGVGATGYCSIRGSLQEIRIIDPGFDYIETPKIDITGGNGTGAKASASMKLIDHQVVFNSESQSARVNLTNGTIGFSTYHKFRNTEKVIYRTNAQQSVGGISTNSIYYVSTKDLYTIKLHKTFEDALVGVNTISLTSYGVGNHVLESYNKKSVISSIIVENSGSNYENKKRTITSSGVSTSLGYISISDHGFNSGEIVKYSTDGSAIGGLQNNTEYYITKVDSDNFKLSFVGVSTDVQDFYYKTNQYIKLTSTGSGTHSFNYPEVTVSVVGNVGIASTSDNLFKAIVQPIFRGEVSSIYLENGGVGYGSSDIINFNRLPNITLNSGSECQLIPVINNGKIAQVLINNPGKDYNSPPNLTIRTNGSGVGAVLTPILENGQVKSVKIVESGGGYDPNNTFITVASAGTGAELDPKLKTWTINLFERYFKNITDDDGFIFYNPNSKYGLQYTHLYAPRKLRENLYSKDIQGRTLYGEFDLRKSNNGEEIASTSHSPIIGWAYDGNPIYGPYGYSKKDGIGGTITRMKSGYKNIFNTLSNRPPFAEGFFVEDYEYRNSDSDNDDSILDKYNGRFCVTPDFPNGTYAYFTTINEVTSSSNNTTLNNFNNYRIPVFPYLIGNYFKSVPNEFNFSRSSNQDDIDLNETDWVRNTTPYNLLKDNADYSYLNLPNSLNQTVSIKYASPGSIESVGIITGGSNYKVNDKIIFDDTDTSGFGFSSKVSRVSGKAVNSVSASSTTIYNAEIYSLEGNKNSLVLQSSNPHNLSNRDVVFISGLSTTSTILGGSYNIGVSTNILAVSNPAGIGSIGVTGIATFISVSGNLDGSYIRENDILLIGNEKVKVLNVDKQSSRIQVLRAFDGTVGSAHSSTDFLYELPRRLSINVGSTTSYTNKVNKEIYFNPAESLGIGTISGAGIGKTITFSNPGVGITQIFIPTKAIYIPNHNLNTGDELTYSLNSGDSISVSSNGAYSFTLQDQSKVYAARISNDLIGISTVKVGLGSTGTFVGIATTTSSLSTLYFTGIGTGTYHSFKTNYNKLSGQVSKNIVTVSTAQTHGLLNGDEVFMDVNPGVSTSIVIKYNDYNRKVLVNPKSFISAGINTITDAITIVDHKFETGQKVVHTSEVPAIGLSNNQIYYVVVFDKDTVFLSPSYYSATSLTPDIVGITSASYGTLSPVNPPIKVYRDSTVNFDLSDSSLSYLDGPTRYSAFELNFYLDSNYTQIFDKSINGEDIEVVKTGRVGIDSTAKVSLSVNSNTPQKLYYKLDLIDNDLLPDIKSEVNVDTSVISNNQIQVSLSDYNGKYSIVSTSSTSFTYNTERSPEYVYYGTSSSLKYETTSTSAFGAVSKVKILSKGQKYNKLPKFVDISSTFGSGAILDASSTSVGKVQKTRINNIGFDFSCDYTVRPNIILPQVLKIEPLNSLEYIGITSVGRGYLTAPKLLVFDGKTNDLLSEVDLKYSLGDRYVTILDNTYRLSEVAPVIIPTQNSNGVGISSLSYNQTTKDVTVTLSVGFSTANSFPFVVNDRVLIENISVGINSTGKGFNSENYNYQLFTVTSVDENLGGYGSVTYNLGDYISAQESPGTYDEINSSGRIIAEKHFPQFDVGLKSNKFFENEDVRYVGESSPIGFVQNWDEKIKYIRISSREIIESGRTLEGLSSKTQGKVSSSVNFEGFINVGAYSKVENGWTSETGVLNDNLQRMQDNFYYQNFSYSLSSRVPYDTWENAVGSLNHTAGFKKFSDYQLESFAYSGISTDVVSNVDVTVDIDGVVNLNCFYDFDLASENVLINDSRVLSDEITFSSRVLTDYYESVGNRVLSIDDISPLFNSNPRSTNYSVVHRFYLSDARAQKYITYVRDKRYTSQRQLMIFTLLHDDTTGYLNQYGRVETVYDLGSFDFSIEGNEGLILFYPTKYKVNNYDITTLSFNLKDNFAGVGSTSLGDIVKLETNTIYAGYASTTIVSAGSSYTSLKVLSEVYSDNGEYQFDELNLVHDGTNIELLNYGQLSTHSYDAYSSTGLGTYYPYFSGSNINIDFVPNVGTAASISTIQISIANTSMTGIGTFDIRYVRFEARTTSIASSSSPTSNVVAEYSNDYYGGYFIVQVSDITNNRNQLSEVVVVNDTSESYFTEFANIETYSSLGTVGTIRNTNSTQLTFTPISNIQTEVKVFFMSLNVFDIINPSTQYNNNTAVSDYGVYYGTENDIARSFELKHKTYPIFQRYFDGSNSSTVSVASSTITVPNHFFVSGEKITYSSGQVTALSTPSPIGIASTDFGVGIGTTDKLPSSVYVIKIDENRIKLARNIEDALATVPKALDITSVGIGTSHIFTSQKQNVKSLILIDNIIQNPIVSTSTTTYLSGEFLTIDDLLYSDSTSNFYIGDLISINNEIMKIESVGVGSTNSVRVIRPWLGTELANHSIGSTITKIDGNYNIIENKIHFAEAPYGKVPLGTTTNSPDEIDWNELSTNSSFQGRTFMRSGVKDSSNESYYKNYIFDDISTQFNGFQNTFTLKSNKNNVIDIFGENGIFLINNIFQYPGIQNNYTLGESAGITSISFVGAGISLPSDINTSGLPGGGVIVSVGSTEGFGYQPLVSAGGTAIVSAAGTISSISIGNSGSGYRSSIYTLSGIVPVTVRVGVATSSTGTPSIHFVGTASVSNGNVVSIAITNPGIGYTRSNPPYVVIDSPISYSDIPLIYSPSSSGIGTRATVDVVVGQETKVIGFEIKNTGYGYETGDILTIPTSGPAGIPTVANSTIREFQVSVQSVDNDRFFGWSMGEFQILDDIQRFFDGRRTVYTLYYNSQIISIYARKGSPINIQDTLLVFVNDVLQVPGEGYVFNGGSKIKFTEALKSDDICRILFYKGSGDDVDVIYNDIIETVKIGDDLQLKYDSYVGQSPNLLEDQRVVSDILSIDTVETNPYFGPGNTTLSSLFRPITWCKQSEDLVINEQDVTKDRILYEPLIYPTTYLIQPVGVGSTIIFVENLRPFFNPANENGVSLDFQNNVTFIPQEAKVSASATAVVSVAGTISSIVIGNGGFGYLSAPNVTIQNPVGIGTTTSTASASISSGIVTSISITGIVTGYSQENPPVVLIEPPVVGTESDKVISYTGDFGIIAGISTVSVGVASTGIVFDFFIPTNSPLRNGLIAGVTTVSGIQTGYYFVISDSNVGNGVTSLNSSGSVVGSTTSFLDGVYQVSSVSIAQTSIIGVGVTYVAKVTTSVSSYNGLSGIGYSNYFGNYSWGRVFLRARSKETQYNSYTNNGYLGISTGTIVKRTAPLKYSNYI